MSRIDDHWFGNSSEKRFYLCTIVTHCTKFIFENEFVLQKNEEILKGSFVDIHWTNNFIYETVNHSCECVSSV